MPTASTSWSARSVSITAVIADVVASASRAGVSHAVLREDGALLVDDAAGDLGASDVDADRQAHRRRLLSSARRAAPSEETASARCS